MKKMFFLFILTFFFLNTVGLNCGDGGGGDGYAKVKLNNYEVFSEASKAIKFQSNHQQSVKEQSSLLDSSLDKTIQKTQNELEIDCKDSANREIYSKSLPIKITSKNINKQRIRN